MQGLGCSSEPVLSGWLQQKEPHIFDWLIPLCAADGGGSEEERGRVKPGGRGGAEAEDDEGGEGQVEGEGGRRRKKEQGLWCGRKGVRTQLPNNAMVFQP